MYAQEVNEFAYYEVITKSAERAVPGCADAVRTALTMLTSASKVRTTLATAARAWHDARSIAIPT